MDVLSEDEIDKLLNAINEGEKTVSSNCPKVKIYDFNRPDKFTKQDKSFIEKAINECLPQMNSFFSQQLNKSVTFHILDIDELLYEEFCRSIHIPTELTTANISDYPVIIECDPFVYKTWANAEKDSYCSIDLTEKEATDYLKNQITPTLNFLQDALTRNFNLKDCYFSKPHFTNHIYELKDISPEEMVLLVVIELTITDDKNNKEMGIINICFSWQLVRKWFNILNNVQESEATTINLDNIQGTKLPIEIVLGGTEKSIQEIKDIKKGSIVEIDKLTGEPAELHIAGKKVATGEVVLIDERFALRVTEILK